MRAERWQSAQPSAKLPSMVLGSGRVVAVVSLLVVAIACGKSTRNKTQSDAEGGESSGGAAGDSAVGGGGATGGGGGAASEGGGGTAGTFMGEAGAASVECIAACAPGEVCVNGECRCAPSLTRCGAICTSLKTDWQNCGECGNSCGEESCSAGQCQCRTGTDDCDPAEGLQCIRIVDDEQNCGACGDVCLAGSKCEGENCDAELEFVRLFGGSSVVPAASPLVMDGPGNLYVGFNSSGEHRQLGAAGVLWNGAAAVVKLDAGGVPLWQLPTTGTVSALAQHADEVWVSVSATDADLELGDTTFPLAPNHRGITLAVQLAPESGAVRAVHRFDTELPVGKTELAVDFDGAWLGLDLAGGSVEYKDYADAAEIPPSAAYRSALFTLGESLPRWLPGSLLSLGLDEGKLVAAVEAPSEASFSFGGVTLTTGVNAAHAGARFDKLLAHEASFLSAPDYGTSAGVLLPYAGTLLFAGRPEVLLERYYLDGTLAERSSELGSPLSLLAGATKGERLFFTGITGPDTVDYQGRSLPGQHTPLFLYVDPSGPSVRAAFAFETDAAGGAVVPREASLAVADDLSAAVVSVPFDGVFQLGAQTYGEDGVQGVALIRTRLSPP